VARVVITPPSDAMVPETAVMVPMRPLVRRSFASVAMAVLSVAIESAREAARSLAGVEERWGAGVSE
jgi:hypothetical protein